MSDGIWIALIAAVAGVVGPMGLALVNHRLGQRDRSLASATVAEKNRELRKVRTRNRRLVAENRRLRLRRSRPRNPR